MSINKPCYLEACYPQDIGVRGKEQGMITYSREARDSYIATIERLQAELGNVPINIIDYSDLHWLIHRALDDLKKEVKKEHR